MGGGDKTTTAQGATWRCHSRRRTDPPRPLAPVSTTRAADSLCSRPNSPGRVQIENGRAPVRTRQGSGLCTRASRSVSMSCHVTSRDVWLHQQERSSNRCCHVWLHQDSASVLEFRSSVGAAGSTGCRRTSGRRSPPAASRTPRARNPATHHRTTHPLMAASTHQSSLGACGSADCRRAAKGAPGRASSGPGRGCPPPCSAGRG